MASLVPNVQCILYYKILIKFFITFQCIYQTKKGKLSNWNWFTPTNTSVIFISWLIWMDLYTQVIWIHKISILPLYKMENPWYIQPINIVSYNSSRNTKMQCNYYSHTTRNILSKTYITVKGVVYRRVPNNFKYFYICKILFMCQNIFIFYLFIDISITYKTIKNNKPNSNY